MLVIKLGSMIGELKKEMEHHYWLTISLQSTQKELERVQ